MLNVEPNVNISIHALREEGDLSGMSAMEQNLTFLSTPSARRATLKSEELFYFFGISIHALREEGDFFMPVFLTR